MRGRSEKWCTGGLDHSARSAQETRGWLTGSALNACPAPPPHLTAESEWKLCTALYAASLSSASSLRRICKVMRLQAALCQASACKHGYNRDGGLAGDILFAFSTSPKQAGKQCGAHLHEPRHHAVVHEQVAACGGAV